MSGDTKNGMHCFDCYYLTVTISQTWDIMISWSDNYNIDFQCFGQKVRDEIRHTIQGGTLFKGGH